MAQYPIPQFIEKEGKIISFLTFRQFFLLVGGGAVCFFFYFVLPFSIFVILSLIVGIMVAAIAFLRVNNESIVKLFLNFITFSTAKKNYIWDKKESAYPFKIKKSPEIKRLQDSVPLKIQPSKLKEIKKLVEIKR